MITFAAQGPMLEVPADDNGSLYYRRKDADAVIKVLQDEATELLNMVDDLREALKTAEIQIDGLEAELDEG